MIQEEIRIVLTFGPRTDNMTREEENMEDVLSTLLHKSGYRSYYVNGKLHTWKQ
jgi:hypothetical protein